MDIYKNGDCQFGGDVIIVKNNFDLFIDNHMLVEKNNVTGKITILIDFKDTSNVVFTETQFCELINKYDDIKKYCYAEITLIDMIALITVLCHTLPQLGRKKYKALEIGSWGGASSFIISSVIHSFSDVGQLICMDTWKGTPATESHCIANYENMFNHFSSVMNYFGVRDMIIPIIAPSECGLELLADKSFDIVFIDAAHTYSGVKNDIKKALQKVKNGGILMGHDCECYFTELPKMGLDKDIEEAEGYHVGVIKALHDTFGEDFSIVPGSKVWYRRM